MGILSYAQNFEDVILWRVLGHIKNGSYVDVGAQDPRIDSVSRAFYENGWRGVHVEPVPAFAAALRADRPDETVLQLALAERPGTLELNVFADTGLSTAVDHYAARHELERGYAVERITVPVLTLTDVLQSFHGEQVHWLKIDVEGFEEQVLRGWDSKTVRPWVILVEATIPNSPETDFAGWDPILVGADYRFVYFDGLNRFYIAAEHPELAAGFGAPPNVFDFTELAGSSSWDLCRPVKLALGELVALAEAGRDTAVSDLTMVRAEALAGRQREDGLRASLAVAEAVLAEAHAWRNTSAVRIEELAGKLAQLKALEHRHQADLAATRDLLAQANARLDIERESAHRWWRQAEVHSAQIAAIYASSSWRLTRPVRLAKRVIMRTRALAGRLRRRLHEGSAATIAPSASANGASAASTSVVARAQGGARIRHRRLSPAATRVLGDLQQAIEKKQP